MGIPSKIPPKSISNVHGREARRIVRAANLDNDKSTISSTELSSYMTRLKGQATQAANHGDDSSASKLRAEARKADALRHKLWPDYFGS
jgi:hypothetical protein